MADTISHHVDTDYSNLFKQVDLFRNEISKSLDSKYRSEKGQYFTPSNLAQFMASMFAQRPRVLNILDAGAGVGSLSTALIIAACKWDKKPQVITVTAYESERNFVEYLNNIYKSCERLCNKVGIEFASEVICEDFIREAADMVGGQTLFSPIQRRFNAAILNPPYKKINSSSNTRQILRRAGLETSNLYTAFLWLAFRLLEPGGEFVSITPRSFCNGPYFLPFRKAFLKTMSLRQIHVFESRDKAFSDDDILQENIILHAVRGLPVDTVTISTSVEPNDETITIQEVNFSDVVLPEDPNKFIYVIPDRLKQQLVARMRGLSATLKELGLSVSTGKVVDFRVRQRLRDAPGHKSVPLIYPAHFYDGYIHWPNSKTKKPNALDITGIDEGQLKSLLVSSGWYVLVRRFSSKEEKRRLMAAVYNPDLVSKQSFGIENHLNYYHQNGEGLPSSLAKGLAGFLNSTMVDEYFRQFSGHTQVNAADLRNLRYPNKEQLIKIGDKIGGFFPTSNQLDQIIIEELNMVGKYDEDLPISINAKKKIDEALTILREFGLPRNQLNQRSALTLLALSDIKPGSEWAEANAILLGITEMMNYFQDYYGVSYAPNTRETVRRQTVHQFIQIGLVLSNPDDLTRPVNSPHTKYQIAPQVIWLIKKFGQYEWDNALQLFLGKAQQLRNLQVRERTMSLIPVKLPNDKEVKLTAGGQNILIKQIIEDFCARFTPGGLVLYLGDAGEKLRIFERDYLEKLGIFIDEHSKIPDVVVYLPEKNWLILIEAVTSHGPIDIKRYNELKELFKNSAAPLVFVTAFPTRKIMVRYLSEIAWETDVWISENSSHLIHFNGERFLGPYESD